MTYLALFCSGAAALIYQIVWVRQYSIELGATAASFAIIASIFIAGIGTGSAIAQKLIRKSAEYSEHPMLWFCIAEVFVGVSVLFLRFTDQFVGKHFLLLLPTIGMGASFPFAVHSTRSASWSYGWNIVGAACGSIFAGLMGIPNYGMSTTFAIGFCLTSIATVWAYSAHIKFGRQTGRYTPAVHQPQQSVIWLVLAGVVGVVSFASEVVWIRLFVHSIGGSIQATSVMVGSYLICMAAGGMLVGRSRNAQGSLIACLVSIAVYPFLIVVPLHTSAGWFVEGNLNIKCLKAAFVVGPFAFMLGGIYPLLVRLYAGENGQSAGRVMASSSLGNVAGPILALMLIPHLPSIDHNFLHLSAMGSVYSGKTVYQAFGRNGTVRVSEDPHGLLLTVDGMPESIIREKEESVREDGVTCCEPSLAPGEASISLKSLAEQVSAMQWFLSDLPIEARPNASRMLVVGLGGGGCIESLPDHIDRVDVVEIEMEVVKANLAIRRRRHIDPLDDKRVYITVGDARKALNGWSSKRWDIIISQPSHPWTEGSSHLYTREFLKIAKSRLEEGGVFIQWIELGFLSDQQFESVVLTLRSVFQNVELYMPFPDTCYFISSDSAIGLEGSPVSKFKKPLPEADGTVNTDDLNLLARPLP